MKISIIPREGTDTSALYLHFKRGRLPATQGINNGECAWLDRGVSSEEPAVLRWISNFQVDVHIGPGNAVQFDTKGGSSRINKGILKVLRAVRSGEEFQVHAAAKTLGRQRLLLIQRFGP